MGTVHNADVMAWANQYEGERYHALLADPPYELKFMGRKWDGTGISFRPELWQALGKLLYPGAFGMAFASTRGYHRMAVAIEDAGFIIHPMIAWVFSSGFPKATRVKDAPAFAGHRYGGQALAPSLEPVVVFQKPYHGKPRDCIVATGAGALNIEAARIPANGEKLSGGMVNGTSRASDGWDRPWRHDPDAIERNKIIHAERIAHAEAAGRWAKNFVLCHSRLCTMFACSPDCPVQRMDMQTGELKSGERMPDAGSTPKFGGIYQPYEGKKANYSAPSSGTGSRFFFNADYLLDRREDTDPFTYVAKAGTTEREAGLTGFSLSKGGGMSGTLDQSMLTGSGNIRDNNRHNTHPTVKPLALAQHFASLLLPPVEYAPRRLLVPFAGSGSEMIGAMLAGWEHIDGIELEADYVKIARARLDYWKAHQPNMAGKKKPKAAIKKVDSRQMALL